MTDIPALPLLPEATVWLGEVATVLASALDCLELASLEQGSTPGTLDLRWSILAALGEIETLKPV